MIHASPAVCINFNYMCLAHPGKIIKINGENALVDFHGIKKDVNISLVKARRGDYVMVHAGFAIQKMTSEDAVDVLKLYEEAEKIKRINLEHKQTY